MIRKILLVFGVVVLLFLLVAFSVSAANPPFTRRTIDAGCYTAVAVGDIDDDGDLDVVSASQGAPNIEWWENAGAGAGWTKHAVSSASFTFEDVLDIVLDDFDRDGDMDIVARSRRKTPVTEYGQVSCRFVWFENKGSNTWKTWDLSSSLGCVHALAPDKLTLERGYARVPLVVDNAGYSCGHSGKLELVQFRGDYSGGYTLLGTVSRTDSLAESAIYLTDLDRDGDTDIVTANANGVIDWFASRENEARKDYIEYSIGSVGAVALDGGDIDRDGDVDLFVGSETAGLLWYKNRGDARAWPNRYYITRQDAYVDSGDLGAADLDRDGDLDVATVTKSRKLVWWENLGKPDRKGGWNRHALHSYPKAASINWLDLALGDIDGDGQTDIATCDCRKTSSGYTGTLDWWENGHAVPKGDDLGFVAVTVNSALPGAWGVDVADFNRDGRLDVVAAGYGTTATKGKTRWWRNTPGQPVKWVQAYADTFDKARGVTAGDLTRSGWPGYLVAGSGRVRWSESANAGATFKKTVLLSGLGSVYEAAVVRGPYNAIPDVAVGSSTSGELWRAVSSRSATTHAVTWSTERFEDDSASGDAACAGARAIAACDLDGDGQEDIAVACQGENRIYWWEYNSTFPWPKHRIPVYFSGVTDIACDDIDGDGKNEIVAASPGLWSIVWFKPNAAIGDGTTMGWVTDVFTGVQYIDLVDVDRDGDLDVWATSAGHRKVAWFENEVVTPSVCYVDCFTPHVIDEAVGTVREIASGDIDGDGAPDAVVAIQSKNTVRWYRQQVGAGVGVKKPGGMVQRSRVASAGHSTPYVFEVTNSSWMVVDAMVVGTWEPSNAVVDASGEGCVAVASQGVMTCTYPSLQAEEARPVTIILTPSLSYEGWLTTTARVVTEGPTWNTTPYYDTAQADPVRVERDNSIYDLLVYNGQYPQGPIFPGGSFQYEMVALNTGPKAMAAGTLASHWWPADAVAGLEVVGVSGVPAATGASPVTTGVFPVAADIFPVATGSSSVATGSSPVAANAANCTVDSDPWAVVCDLDLTVDAPITVTVAVTTSRQFTDVLESTVTLSGPDEGNPANNQTWPIRVAPWYLFKVYLPFVLRNISPQ